MTGLLRAELIRFRGRASSNIIILAVPLLAAFGFLASYQSTMAWSVTFDEAALRAELLNDPYYQSLPPEEAEMEIEAIIEADRQSYGMAREQQQAILRTFAFPQSILTMLGSATLGFFALILLTATMLGDEFGWGTIRSSLIATTDRRRFLAARLAALGVATVVIVGGLLLLGVVTPAVLGLVGAQLPAAPAVDGVGLAVLVLVLLVASAALIAFAALATLLVRSGAVALVVALVYTAAEMTAQGLLQNFEAFRQDGDLEWLATLLPVRAIATAIGEATNAAGRAPSYMGEEIVVNFSAVWLPLSAVAVVGLVMLALAFRRLLRMDIAE